MINQKPFATGMTLPARSLGFPGWLSDNMRYRSKSRYTLVFWPILQ